MQDERLAALNAIEAFPNEELLHEFLARHGHDCPRELPPYLKMARVASIALAVSSEGEKEQATPKQEEV